MNKRKISFEELCDFVANIDYIDSESWPVVFEVHNGNKPPTEYECGITDVDNSMEKNNKKLYELIEKHVCGEVNEIQYFKNNNTGEFLDLDDPDSMLKENIDKMLMKECNIKENSEIFFLEDDSFGMSSGTGYLIWENKLDDAMYPEKLINKLKK